MNRKERRASERRNKGVAGPADAESLFRAGFAHQRAGRPAEAFALYQRVLALRPDEPEVLHWAGVAAYEQNDFATAARLIGRAVARVPGKPEFHNNLGNALRKLGRVAEAEGAFCEAVRLAPGYADAHHNLGNLLREGGRLDKAVAEYRRALQTQPNDAQVHHSLGLTLHSLGLLEEAADALWRATEIKPDHRAALFHLGILLRQQNRLLGSTDCFQKLIALDPTDVRALVGLAGVLERKGDHEEALAVLRKALAVDPHHPQATAESLKGLEHLCAWDEAARSRPAVRQAALEALERGTLPFEEPLLSIARDMDSGHQLRLAGAYSRILAEAVAPFRDQVAAIPRPAGDGRITIGYMSSDFRNHAVGHLISGLFEHHDRKRFRVIAYSIGADDGSVYRRRVETGCDAFVAVQPLGAPQAARRIHEDGVDILVDLNGHTVGNRLDVLALRPAPVQVAYLGFPGTTGAGFIDYILADAVVAPPEHAPFFSEKVVHLPGCYLVNGQPPIVGNRPARSDCGLPDEAFVFSSFCASYKIEPVMFGVWMDILRRVPGSVLWLARNNPPARDNLRREAEARGLSPARIIFADWVDAKEDHLARLRLADLGLDTRVYGGHATTSDMLWAGVPVVTLLGGHFASRVGASLLKTAGLDELVATSLESYRDLAVGLANDSAALAVLRARLAESRPRSPLFDLAALARHMESAYTEMVARHRAGLPPAAFAVGAGRD